MMKRKIGILTYHRSINYGAFLQAYCLLRYVKNIAGNKADVEIIDYVSSLAYQQYNKLLFHRKHKISEWKKRIGFERSCHLLPLSKEFLCSDDISQIEHFLQRQNYDLIIAGSDEIWKVDGVRGFPTAYWLNFDIGDCKRMSYAASSRTELNRLDAKKQDYINNSVKQFCYLGVRDQMTMDLIWQISGKKPSLNCDPAFLYPFHFDKSAYKEKIYRKFRIEKNRKLLGVMIPDSKLVSKIQENFGKQYQIIALHDFHDAADNNMVGLNPFEWVKVIACLDFLVTDRFHGTVFAMKMGTPFLSVETYDTKETSKLYYLLSSNGLEQYYIEPNRRHEDFDMILNKAEWVLENYNAEMVKKAVVRERKKCKSFKEEFLKICNERVPM